MKRPRIVILGAGFGGLELSTVRSEALGDAVDFFSESKPTGTFQEPFAAQAAEKERFGLSRRVRWFGR